MCSQFDHFYVGKAEIWQKSKTDPRSRVSKNTHDIGPKPAIEDKLLTYHGDHYNSRNRAWGGSVDRIPIPLKFTMCTGVAKGDR